ncbi:hypothetical protein N7453_006717 [Penicillium expansum]|nr:hypothetical protein N7453_006717 [Penicillium expansum]
MDVSGSEYQQPSLPSGTRKRQRSAGYGSLRARKKRKPVLDDLRKVLLAVCERQIVKHKFGSVSRKLRRSRYRSRPYVFPRLRSPLRELVKIEEDLPTFWERLGRMVAEIVVKGGKERKLNHFVY